MRQGFLFAVQLDDSLFELGDLLLDNFDFFGYLRLGKVQCLGKSAKGLFKLAYGHASIHPPLLSYKWYSTPLLLL